MEENKQKISSFTSLITWQEAHKLTVFLYKKITKFPEYERFGLSDQLRRSVSSVPSNIAEGFGRKTNKDKAHFYYIANGSLTETHNHIILARDLGYTNEEDFKIIENQIFFISRLLHGLIKALHL